MPWRARTSVQVHGALRASRPQLKRDPLGSEIPLAKIELYDEAGAYYFGKVKEGGKVDLYDQGGQYWYGKVKPDGKIELWDQNGGYYWGKVKDTGRIDLYDQNGNHRWYGKVKD